MFIKSTLTTVDESTNRQTIDGYTIDVKYYSNNPSAMALQISDKNGYAAIITTNMSDSISLVPYAYAYLDRTMPSDLYNTLLADNTMSPVTINGQQITAITPDGFNAPLMAFNKKALERFDPEGTRIYTNAYNNIRNNADFTPSPEIERLKEQSLSAYGYTNEMFTDVDYDSDAASEPSVSESDINIIKDENALNLLKLKQMNAYSDELKNVISTKTLINEKTTFNGYYSADDDEFDNDTDMAQNPVITHQGNTPDGKLLIGEFTIDEEHVKYKGVPNQSELSNSLLTLYQQNAIDNVTKNYDMSQPIVTTPNMDAYASNLQCIIVDSIDYNKQNEEININAIAVNGEDIITFPINNKGADCIPQAFETLTKSYNNINVIMTSNTPIVVTDGNKQTTSYFNSSNYNASNDIERTISEYDGRNEIIAMDSANAVGFDALRAISHKSAENKVIPNAKSTTIAALYNAFVEYDIEMMGADSQFIKNGQANMQSNQYTIPNYQQQPQPQPKKTNQFSDYPASKSSKPVSSTIYMENISKDAIKKSRKNPNLASIEIKKNPKTNDQTQVVVDITDIQEYPDTDKMVRIKLSKGRDYPVITIKKGNKEPNVEHLSAEAVMNIYDESGMQKSDISGVPKSSKYNDRSYEQ